MVVNYKSDFVSTIYQMITMRYETLPADEDIWIECIGDLGRYRVLLAMTNFTKSMF